MAGRAGRGTGRLLVAVVVAAVSSTTALIAVTAVTATTVATIAALRRVVLEVLVLLLHVAEQILTQRLRSLDLIWVRTTVHPVSRDYCG